MNEFQVKAAIDRPPEAVFAALVNFERIPDWNSSVMEVKWNRHSPIGVGSTMTYVGRFLGRSFESPTEITEYVACSKYSLKSTSGPFVLEIEDHLEPVGDGTLVTSTFRGESRGFFKLAEPVITRLAKKMFEASTDNLKALLEANAL